MSKREQSLFQVGQLAESRSFLQGYRGAWFRCEIKEVAWNRGQVKYYVQYCDYDDGLEWLNLHEVHKSSKGSKKSKRELMLRPQFPPIYPESELPDMNVISDVAVVVDGGWSVGDLVDWQFEGCFWSGTITKFLGDDIVQIKLPDKPVGEGMYYDACCKDLRPSLNWSPDSGWRFPIPKGSHNGHSHARLIQHVKQDANQNAKATPRSSLDFNDSISSHTSASSLPLGPLLSRLMPSKVSPKLSKDISEKDRQLAHAESMELDTGGSAIRKASCSDSVSSTCAGDASAEVPVASSVEKEDPETVSAKRMRVNEPIPLTSTSCDSIESAIMDLEELVCRINWLKQILKPESSSTSKDDRWEFLEYPAVPKPK